MNEHPLIVALDFPSIQHTQSFLQRFDHEKIYVKVGMELYYKEGPAILYHLKETGHKIFLDLKLHDIPHTVKYAMKQIASLGVDMVNVHATGGKEMMMAAKEGLEIGSGKENTPKCIAVTQLTSIDEEMIHKELLIEKSLEESVKHFSQLAYESSLDGVVCSPHEVPLIKYEDFITVTPGIRLSTDQKNDQKRVTTPEEAKKLGSTAIVVGRSITRSDDPYTAYLEIKKQWEEA
ncbi:orotidine-5'-phosphate decarboxylase [Bacillus carboniphilus]|uniref:Orotidine 5'-phosphate decarboxylase n=1 Tax=Bacillus carboniphilus TaxID=86663 RepID=A0ABY9JW12_9BACI|nr:orotidine-5'-phosphate decarboxylase [Bacillus carboniphilus]WLR43597.1 orotidine-5'-phosphate decarboxylase [Bacillus carboniphilus]